MGIPTTVASFAEVHAAQAFLKYLGAPWQNNLLVVAVVAWMRQESGGLSRVIGNNPFNLRPGADDAAFRSGMRGSPKWGYFSLYPTLEKGLQATAARLLGGMNDWRGYGKAVIQARLGNPVEFLNAIAMSAWDSAHYGMPYTNHLLTVYSHFTGLQLTGPNVKPPAPKPPPPKRKIPPPVKADIFPPLAPVLRGNYIDGYAIGTFYRSRHRGRPSH